MGERNTGVQARTDAGRATAEAGLVILDGPDGVAVTMTPEAAEQTAHSLQAAAERARAQSTSNAGEGGDADGEDSLT